MLAHAQSEYPNECCGLLAGVLDAQEDILRAVKHYPLINEAASPIEYRSEPHSLFQAVKAMRQDAHDIVAIYHSHPTSAPVPSRTDLERNDDPEMIHFIISLKDAQPQMRGWRLTKENYEEAVWQIVDG